MISLTFIREYIDHFEFRKVNPKLDKRRLCFESRSTNNRFKKSNEGGNVLYFTQLKIRLKSNTSTGLKRLAYTFT